MYSVWKNQLRNLSNTQFEILRELCRLSKNLYNSALYSVRQHYFVERKYLSYESNYHVCKDNENYKLLNTDIAQQTMKVVDRNFKSFFSLIKKAKSGSYQFNAIKLPHYLPKAGYFSLIIPRVKVKEIRIHPKYEGRFFELEFVYLQEEQPSNLNSSNALAIDLGLDNLATCVTNTGASFVIDGRRLKSVNQWYNKENARLQSIKDKQGIKGTTRKQAILIINHNNAVNDYLNKTARLIVDYCLKNNIGNIVTGYNLDWKRGINLGKNNNQKFAQIPHGKLRLKLESLCQRYVLNYLEQEESYTSKADFFANDELPVFNADNPQEYSFSGKRISRGQYKSSQGMLINADCNGALNILRKSKLIGLTALQSRGCLDQPLRIRIA